MLVISKPDVMALLDQEGVSGVALGVLSPGR